MTYNFFTKYYDNIIRGNWYSLSDEVDLIQELIVQYWNQGKTILEFACGTWVVARELQKKWYEVFGIDLSETMLEKAKKNMWTKNCELWDMTTLKIWRKFDIVLCNYNSICHLTSWEQWQEFFQNAHLHLEKWGILIFDINTVSEFENIARDFAQFYNIWNDTVCLEMQKRRGLYHWIVKMFIKNDAGNYSLETETIPELSFEISEIQTELETQWFSVVHLEDFHKWTVDTESERVYFIAKKND